jgi:hypothetical protein
VPQPSPQPQPSQSLTLSILYCLYSKSSTVSFPLAGHTVPTGRYCTVAVPCARSFVSNSSVVHSGSLVTCGSSLSGSRTVILQGRRLAISTNDLHQPQQNCHPHQSIVLTTNRDINVAHKKAVGWIIVRGQNTGQKSVTSSR